MRIAHAHGTAKQRFLANTHDVGFLFLLGAKWNFARFKFRHTHIDGDLVIVFYIENHFAFLGADADAVFVGQPFHAHKTGETTRSVATLLDFATIGIKNTVVEIRFGIIGRLDHQQLVEANACVTIRQTADQFLREVNVLGNAIDHHKVVTQTVHFGKMEMHKSWLLRKNVFKFPQAAQLFTLTNEETLRAIDHDFCGASTSIVVRGHHKAVSTGAAHRKQVIFGQHQ